MKSLFNLCTFFIAFFFIIPAFAQFELTNPHKPQLNCGHEHDAKASSMQQDHLLPPSHNETHPDQSRLSFARSNCPYGHSTMAALTPTQLVNYLLGETDYDCLSFLFTYDATHSPAIFSNANVHAVLDEFIARAAQYDGTYSNGMYGIVFYTRLYIYINSYYPNITIGPNELLKMQQAANIFSANPHILDLADPAYLICENYLIVLDFTGLRHLPSTMTLMNQIMEDWTLNDNWSGVADLFWVTSKWRIFFLMDRGNYNDPDFIQAIQNDPDFLNLVYAVASDADIRSNPNLEFLSNNAVYILTTFAQHAVINPSVCSHLGNLEPLFPRLDPQWLQIINAVNTHCDCQAMNLCEDDDDLRQEVIDLLFPNTYSFDDGRFEFLSKLTSDRATQLYYAANQVKAQFFRMIQTDEPVSADPNENMQAIVFENKQVYDDYAGYLYGIPTNNGGIYIESRGTFYTWDRPDSYGLTLEELFRHEYTHYLQGRYWIPDMWAQHPLYDNGRMVWIEEGSGELFTGATDDQRIKLLETWQNRLISDQPNWLTVSEIIESNYNSGGFPYYPYGNFLWYYLYTYDYGKIKEITDILRAGDVPAFDALMAAMKLDVGLQNGFTNFLTDVVNGNIDLLEPNTDWINKDALTIEKETDLANAFTQITSVNPSAVDITAEGIIRRFDIQGNLQAIGNTSNDTETALLLEQTLDDLITDLKADPWSNNFDYIAGYFENISPPGTNPSADFHIIGSLRDTIFPDIVLANFTANKTYLLAGDSVQFSNTSIGYIDSLRWNFTGVSPNFSIDIEESVTYHTPGIFDVNLDVFKQQVLQSSKNETQYIEVYPANNQSHCMPSHLYPDTRKILQVTTGGLDHHSDEGLDGNGYSDYKNLLLEYIPGQVNDFFLDVNAIFALPYAQHAVGVWIDFNQDGVFNNTNEKVLELRADANIASQGYYQTQIPIPTNVPSGVTTLRVRHVWLGTNDAIDPCNNTSEGETEDYSIIFNNNMDQAPPTPPVLSNGKIEKTTVVLKYPGATDNVGIAEYEIYYKDQVIGYSSGSTYTVTGLSPCTEYTFYVKAKDAAGNISTSSNEHTILTESNPVVNVNGPYFGVPDSLVYFSSQGTYDKQGPYSFVAWLFGDGNVSSDLNPTHAYASPGIYTVSLTIIDTAGLVTQKFTTVEIINGYLLRTVTQGNGSITLSPPQGAYPANSMVQATATADPQNVFLGWTDDLSGTNPSQSLLLDDHKRITALFDTFPYCIPVHQYPNTRQITRVIFNDIDNSSGPSASGHSYFHQQSTTVDPGQNYPIEVHVPEVFFDLSNTSHRLGVWIDFNDNGQFESSELVVDKKADASVNTLGYYTANIQIPTNAASISTKMRVRHMWENNNSPLDPCSLHGEGEAEDYNVKILNPDCNLVTDNNDHTGAGSLRYAIGCALPGDTIRFASSLNGQSISIDNTPISIDKELNIYVPSSMNISFISNWNGLMIFNDSNSKLLLQGMDIYYTPSTILPAIFNQGELILHDVNLRRLGPATNHPSLENNGELRVRGSVELY